MCAHSPVKASCSHMKLSLIFILCITCISNAFHSSHRLISRFKSSELDSTFRTPLSLQTVDRDIKDNSDVGFSLNDLSLGIGGGGVLVLLVNRLSLDLETVTDIQSRADIISVVACSALLLNALSQFDITARDRDSVSLIGKVLRSPVINQEYVNDIQKKFIVWSISTLLKLTPATSVHIVASNGMSIGRAGVVGLTDKANDSGNSDDQEKDLNINIGPILDLCVSKGEEVYLPDLQIIPGKDEFINFLPINIQSVFVNPIASPNGGEKYGCLVVSTNKAKVLKMTDLAKIRAVANIISSVFKGV